MSRETRYRKVSRVLTADWVGRPQFATKKGRGSVRAGLAFERKVGKELERVCAGQVLHEPWIQYEDIEHGKRLCAPDYLIIDIDRKKVIIVECKLTHTEKAYVQMVDIYAKVLEWMFAGWEIACVEVCKNFNRQVKYPVKVRPVFSFAEDISGFNNVMVRWDL